MMFGRQGKVQPHPKSHTVHSIVKSHLKDLGRAEWFTILDMLDEESRRGNMERIFPTKETSSRYGNLFAATRYTNLVLAKWLTEGNEASLYPDPPPRYARAIPSWVPRFVNFDAL